jgi:predicted metal-dependent peptidase
METLKEADVKPYLIRLASSLEKNESITSSVSGIDFKILKLLYDCQIKGEWNETAWREWNNYLIGDTNVLRNLLSVFIHEYLHIILNHLSTRFEVKKKWNYATDFAINQSCIFTPTMRKVLITTDNKKFIRTFGVQAAVYQYKTDRAFQEKVDDNICIDQDNLYQSIKSRLGEINSIFLHNQDFILNSLNGRSADEYYRILNEIEPPEDSSGDAKGYDNHETWDQDECDVEMEQHEKDDIESENEPTAGDGKDEDEEIEADPTSEEEEADKSPPPADDAERNHKFTEWQKHEGFDALSEIAKRTEARNALKDVLSATGIDTNDPYELMKGLDSIPGFDIIGELLANFFKVKTKNWKLMLQNFMNFAVNVSDPDYTMSRESRTRPDYFPGKRLERGLDCILAMDTSASIVGKDWNDFCNQVIRISKDFNAYQLRVIQCHTRISFDSMVDVSKIKNMKIKETGSTMMQVIFEKLKREKNKKPVILFTDGEIDSFCASQYNFKILMFLSRGHSQYKPILEKQGFKVVCQDEE